MVNKWTELNSTEPIPATHLYLLIQSGRSPIFAQVGLQETESVFKKYLSTIYNFCTWCALLKKVQKLKH